MNQGFGVTPEIRTQMKLAMFYVRDIVFLVGVLGCSVLLGNLFPPQQLVQLICFYVVNSLFGIWLVIQPFSNPGRRNYDLVLSDLIPQQRVFRSFDFQEFSSTTEYVDVEVTSRND
ncbi:DUF5592 family protein [Levilactobacillus brevis]|uniref:DUF5592 family protein n=1 Tax=Levilactobacillus brevis TaxID=1580 RepID=UPI000416EDB0|nr:DUF5592 family protein [Levilactobacillus brevis]